ncbi:MAG: hypothetical protein QG671_4291, partial [Actinomycetota bacterium]|nr:hypothetical protein [Actinomycetota bacterium]
MARKRAEELVGWISEHP